MLIYDYIGIAMTEEEKRRLVLSIMAAEQQRQRSPLAGAQSQLNAALRRSAEQQSVLASLAQQGISWQQLKTAYNEEFERGHSAMLDFHLSYFYAGAAIAYHEYFSALPDDTGSFVRRVAAIPNDYPDRKAIILAAQSLTGVDTTIYDDPGKPPVTRATTTEYCKPTRKDREAVVRMRRTGITKADLEYEKRLGYSNGWNSGFFFSICYAALAIALHEKGTDALLIEKTVDRIQELRYEEITAHDILLRCINETGVDVSNLATASARADNSTR